MPSQSVPLNRTKVGIAAVLCLVVALSLQPWAYDSSNLALWQAALGRVGIVMAALWLALPGRNQPAAWAKLSPRVIGLIVVGLIATSRLSLRILLPGAAVIGLLFLLLRPRPKHRPRR
jgi:hypothetical protein